VQCKQSLGNLGSDHYFTQARERNSSAAAAAVSDKELHQTKTAAAIGCSVWL
jgi:hypothetical protein